MDDTARPSSTPEAGTLARSRLYQLLSVIFLYPTIDLFESLVHGKYLLEFSEALKASPHRGSRLETEFLENVEDIRESVSALSFEDYEVEFTGTFEVGAPGPPCPPSEGLYRKAPARQSIMLQISEFYKHFGLEMDQHEGKRELPDHITAELEFMHFLTFKEDQAREAGDKELLTGYLLAQNDFLQRHPLQWISSFSDKLAEVSQGTVPSIFAELTELFLYQEWDLVAGYLMEMGVDTKPLHVPSERPVEKIIPADDPIGEVPGCNGCAGVPPD